MKKVDNKIFLEFLEKDIIKNFYLCDNIVNSGKDGYAIKSIEIYTIDGTPNNDYIVLTENIFNELIIEVKTNNETLIFDIFSHIKKISKTYGITVIMVSHNTDFIKELSNRAIFMDDGKLIDDSEDIDQIVNNFIDFCHADYLTGDN